MSVFDKFREQRDEAEARRKEAEERRQWAEERAQKAEAACAAKDEALNLCWRDIMEWEQLAENRRKSLGDKADFDPYCATTRGIERSYIVRKSIAKALSSDCGKDYVPCVELKKAQAACAEKDAVLRQFACETCHGAKAWSPECDACLSGEGRCKCAELPDEECPQCQDKGSPMYQLYKDRERALSLDCGKDYVPRAELDAEKAKVRKLRDAITRMFAARATGSWQIEADAAEKAKQALEETK